MKRKPLILTLTGAISAGLLHGPTMAATPTGQSQPPLGLPPVPIPADNPQTPEKIALGDKLFHDTRFSADGKVACSTCHTREKAFTDNLPTSKGFRDLTGTRNAPTVINAAYMQSQFWDGREPDLEGQAKQPPVNPVEGGLPNHEPILAVIREDADYRKRFKKVFGITPDQITEDHVARAIASFERTVIAGDSAFDRYQYGNDPTALNESQKRGLELFRLKGRCASCHTVEHTQSLFTDSRFHNIGIGFKAIAGKEPEIAEKFLRMKHAQASPEKVNEVIDKAVLSDKEISELGRFVISEDFSDIGAFKTPTLRNVAVTFPYMHDGSLKTLEEVVDFYNNGGRVNPDDPLTPFLSGGIKPLDLSDEEKADLVAFLESLTSPQYQQLAGKPTGDKKKTTAKNSNADRGQPAAGGNTP